jgi:hypothetical protein
MVRFRDDTITAFKKRDDFFLVFQMSPVIILVIFNNEKINING